MLPVVRSIFAELTHPSAIWRRPDILGASTRWHGLASPQSHVSGPMSVVKHSALSKVVAA